MQDNTVYDNFISYVQFYLSRKDKERGLKSNPLNCYYLIKNNSLDSLTDFVEQVYKLYINAHTSHKCKEMAHEHYKHLRRLEALEIIKKDRVLLRKIATKIAHHLKSLL